MRGTLKRGDGKEWSIFKVFHRDSSPLPTPPLFSFSLPSPPLSPLSSPFSPLLSLPFSLSPLLSFSPSLLYLSFQ